MAIFLKRIVAMFAAVAVVLAGRALYRAFPPEPANCALCGEDSFVIGNAPMTWCHRIATARSAVPPSIQTVRSAPTVAQRFQPLALIKRNQALQPDLRSSRYMSFSNRSFSQPVQPG